MVTLNLHLSHTAVLPHPQKNPGNSLCAADASFASNRLAWVCLPFCILCILTFASQHSALSPGNPVLLVLARSTHPNRPRYCFPPGSSKTLFGFSASFKARLLYWSPRPHTTESTIAGACRLTGCCCAPLRLSLALNLPSFYPDFHLHTPA